MLIEQRDPWYRKILTFLPDTISVQCFTLFLFIGIFCTISGMVMTGGSYSVPSNSFRPLSEKKIKEMKIIRIMGPVTLATGLTFATVGILLRFRLALSSLCNKKGADSTQLGITNQFETRDVFPPSVLQNALDSPSTSTHSIDSRKQLADRMLY